MCINYFKATFGMDHLVQRVAFWCDSFAFTLCLYRRFGGIFKTTWLIC